MKTRMFNTGKDMDGSLLSEAAALLREGKLVAFPTETVYGLGANALDEAAVQAIFDAKGRPSDNPLIVHIASGEALHALVREVPPVAERLMAAFWPGALTLVFRKADVVPLIVTAGLDTVAVRMPVHPVAQALIRLAGIPVAAPSANRSGRPSPTTALHVLEDMEGRIPMIVDGGASEVGVESTVLDVTVEPPMILRPGGVTTEMLEKVVGPVLVDPALIGKNSQPKAPGMKYTHYAPQAPMRLFTGPMEAVESRIRTEAQTHLAEGLSVGVLCTRESAERYMDTIQAEPGTFLVLAAGSRGRPESFAAGVFAALRRFDAEGVGFILAEGFEETGMGHAIMNRLRKAAGGHVVECDNGGMAR